MHIKTGADVSQTALLTTFYTLSPIQIVPESICPSKAVLEDCTALLTGSCAEYKTCWMAPTLGIVRVEHGVYLSRGTEAYIMKRATCIHVGFSSNQHLYWAACLGRDSYTRPEQLVYLGRLVIGIH